MWTLKTLARIETEMLKSQKAKISIERWKIVQKLLIAIFLIIFRALLSFIT